MMREERLQKDIVAFARLALTWLQTVFTLMLPVLTLDLVLFGFVNQGMRSAIPMLVSAESLASYESSLDAEEASLMERSFSAPNSSGVRRFVGRPSQLHPLSPLSRAFCKVAGNGEEARISVGFRLVRDEYDSLGLAQDAMRDSYVRRSLHDLSSCGLALALVRLASALFERRLSAGDEQPREGSKTGVLILDSARISYRCGILSCIRASVVQGGRPCERS